MSRLLISALVMGAIATGTAPAALAEDESECIDQNRLAGPGFPGDAGEAVPDIQVEGFDDGVIANLQKSEHPQYRLESAFTLACGTPISNAACVGNLLESIRRNPIFGVNSITDTAAGRSAPRGEICINMQDDQSGPFAGRAENGPQPETGQSTSSVEPEAAADATKAGEHGEDELAETLEELARHKEAMLRMQADMENLRKRTLRDAERSRKFALERFSSELLAVLLGLLSVMAWRAWDGRHHAWLPVAALAWLLGLLSSASLLGLPLVLLLLEVRRRPQARRRVAGLLVFLVPGALADQAADPDVSAVEPAETPDSGAETEAGAVFADPRSSSRLRTSAFVAHADPRYSSERVGEC